MTGVDLAREGTRGCARRRGADSAARGAPEGEEAMARCVVCGNDYDKSFNVVADGQTHTFDSFECAIHMLAPECTHCGCRIVGHGVEAGDALYCCAHCARHSGVEGVADRA
jgi:hypothetical protein